MRSLSWCVLLAVVGCGTSSEHEIVNYKLELTHVPVCPVVETTDRVGDANVLAATLVIDTELVGHPASRTSFGWTGQRWHDRGPVADDLQGAVMLARGGGKQMVKLRFGVCPAHGQLTGPVRDLGCKDGAVRFYAEQDATIDPKDLAIVGATGESRATIDLPWPTNELPCSTGVARAWPTPL